MFTKSKKPELIAAVRRANLAGYAYQDMDLNEQHREIKKCPAVREHKTGPKMCEVTSHTVYTKN